MSLVALKGIRDILISDSTLTSIVPSQNIVVGWVNQISSFLQLQFIKLEVKRLDI